jgi:hypothetical protein
MSKNHEVKSRKRKVALPPTNLGPLNVVSFCFRVEGDSKNKGAQNNSNNQLQEKQEY